MTDKSKVPDSVRDLTRRIEQLETSRHVRDAEDRITTLEKSLESVTRTHIETWRLLFGASLTAAGIIIATLAGLFGWREWTARLDEKELKQRAEEVIASIQKEASRQPKLVLIRDGRPIGGQVVILTNKTISGLSIENAGDKTARNALIELRMSGRLVESDPADSHNGWISLYSYGDEEYARIFRLRDPLTIATKASFPVPMLSFDHGGPPRFREFRVRAIVTCESTEPVSFDFAVSIVE